MSLFRRVVLSISTGLVFLLGCGGGSSGGGSSAPVIQAPTALAYSTNPAIYTKGTAITINSPSSGGGAVVAYSVSPSLPAGLSLNTSSGVISGTPTAITAVAGYEVTATNSSGKASTTLTITVKDAAPAGLSYSSPKPTYTKGVTIAANSPVTSGGAVLSYGVAPDLPDGLQFDSASGTISGTPKVLCPATGFAVTGTNAAGSVKAEIDVPPEN